MPGESQGQRSLVGYSTWGCKEMDTTEQLTWMGHRRVLTKHGPLEKGMAKHFIILALSMKRQKDNTLKDELPRVVGA